MIKLDATDQGLLSMLRADARASVVDLAKKLGVSRATVQNRMRRLESDGVIAGYTVSVADEIEKPSVRALMSIRAQSADEAKVIAKLRGNPHVSAVHHTTGRWDLIAEIQTDSLASFNQIVGTLRLIDGVTATETNLLLDSYE
ncbi:MAG: Lrp/AsnC family transcriptional regulator [Woeseiaceae bacterium]|nr:Lrp/AsnC family transcriptional regulator [Woeseiaceae bacterium]